MILSPRLAFPTLEELLARYPQSRRRQRLEPIYRAMLEEASELANPQALWQPFSLSEAAALQEWFSEETVAAVLAVCTLGPALDERVERLNQSDMAMAVILEEIALKLVVSLTRGVHTHIRQEFLDQGLKAGPAYRPGVGRWPIEAQRTVFSLLPGAEIGVSLTEDLYMLPLQSSSLVIPILDKTKGAPDQPPTAE